MSTAKQDEAGPLWPERQLRQGALTALRVLETCPLVPVDAFVHLAGLSSVSSAYQQLARLRHGGLANARRVDPGYLVGERSLGCWTITDEGRRRLGRALGQKPGELEAVAQGRRRERGLHNRARIAESDLPLLIASYRLLAALVLERGDRDQVPEVRVWDWPWVYKAQSVADGRVVRMKLPARAILAAREDAVEPSGLREQLTDFLLIPDLGTAPVVRYREMLRRLVALTEFAESDAEPEVVIAAPDPDGTGTRQRAWLDLLARIGRREGMAALQMRVVTWDWVTGKVRPWSPEFVDNDRRRMCMRGKLTGAVGSWSAPARSREQLLHMIGRHPCLTADQLAALLGTGVDRVRRLENELIQDGLLKRIEFEDLPGGGTLLTPAEFAQLGLVEITNAGRRRLAGWLGVSPAAASRYHGLTGNDRRGARRRWRLLRTLAHTVGANGVFVAFGVAAAAVRQRGGSDLLAEWRSAAACERRHCKPDGYGCYVREGVPYGFFLEYDCGTERARKYAAKVRAYYSYRDSPHAARDYNGFPTLLFVTTDPAAEVRMGDQACRAWFIRGTEPLPILSTTSARIREAPEGILGPIWRVPATTSEGDAPLRPWPTSDTLRGSVGASPRAVSPAHAGAWSWNGTQF